MLPKKLYLIEDNCPANKNNFKLQFIHYLVQNLKLFEKVKVFYMIAGHTKFSPD